MQYCRSTPRIFCLGGDGEEMGVNPKAVENLCLTLKIVLQKSCHTYDHNTTLFATAFTYT